MEKWWKKSVFYQIYPRSFQDSNKDGIGDLPGIIKRLPYLKKLGIKGIWLSPVFKSPNVDNGYDVSDYCSIMPEFGTMRDMEQLINEAKKLNIRIIMDLVLNHTSNEHIWFKKALAGDKKYKNYYIFKDGSKDYAPNDIKSFFGGSAWEYVPTLKQYYFHLFAKEQPDLNWDNPQVREEAWNIMRFWKEKGVGGFRLDVIELIGKVPEDLIIGDGPMLHPYLQEMHENVLKGTDLVTIGETGSVTPLTAPLYTSPNRQELSMVFQFQHMALDEIAGKSKWDLKDLNITELKTVLSKWQTDLPMDAWNSLFWSNHDQPRILSRWGDEDYPEQSGKMLAILIHMMRGTPFIYQGEEIGMVNQNIDDVSELNDLESINFYNEQVALGKSKKDILVSINTKGRDNARTPMQWSEDKFAGFSDVKPWYPVNKNLKKINVAAALKDPNSIFYTYQKLIQLRNENNIILYGTYTLLHTEETIFAYTREYNEEEWLVCGNFSNKSQKFVLPKAVKKTILSNYNKIYNDKLLTLEPYETFVVSLVANKE